MRISSGLRCGYTAGSLARQSARPGGRGFAAAGRAKSMACGRRFSTLPSAELRRAARRLRRLSRMRTHSVAQSLGTLFSELVNGPSSAGQYMLNGGDEGLLRSLDKLSADAASARTRTDSSIAAHVDHIRYGLSLMNRWSKGENPFDNADWGASWKKVAVSDEEWAHLRAQLRDEATRWLETLRMPREVQESELNGMIGSVAHIAYHLGAIRQINQALRGPVEPALRKTEGRE